MKRRKNHSTPSAARSQSSRKRASGNKARQSSTQATRPQVGVAESKGGLPDTVHRHNRDHFSELRQRAYEAIAEARKILEEDPEAKQAKTKQARDFLQELRKEALNKGRPRGDRATPGENEKVLGVLWRLSYGHTLKEIAMDWVRKEGDYEAWQRWQRSMSVRLQRFSGRVCEALEEQYGCIPAEMMKESLKSDAYFVGAGVFQQWPGVRLPFHTPALREALKRALEQKH